MAEGLITRLNGTGALEGGYRPVRFAGRIERDESRWVYVSNSIRVVDVAITADGAVPGDGRDVSTRRFRVPAAADGTSVLTGWPRRSGPELTNPLWTGPRTVFLRSGAVASGVTWHVAAKMA